MAVDLPAFAPNMLVRVGFTSSGRAGATRVNSFCEILTLLRATGREFTMVSRDTAVNPLRALRLA